MSLTEACSSVRPVSGFFTIIASPMKMQEENLMPIRILYVENDEDDKDFFSEALKAIQIPNSHTTADSCSSLLKVLETNENFDLIFLDINMPIATGIECLRILKMHEFYKDIPVIMFTASRRQHEIELSYKEGAHFHLIKPVALSNLISSLKIILSINWKDRPAPDWNTYLIDFTYREV